MDSIRRRLGRENRPLVISLPILEPPVHVENPASPTSAERPSTSSWNPAGVNYITSSSPSTRTPPPAVPVKKLSLSGPQSPSAVKTKYQPWTPTKEWPHDYPPPPGYPPPSPPVANFEETTRSSATMASSSKGLSGPSVSYPDTISTPPFINTNASTPTNSTATVSLYPPVLVNPYHWTIWDQHSPMIPRNYSLPYHQLLFRLSFLGKEITAVIEKFTVNATVSAASVHYLMTNIVAGLGNIVFLFNELIMTFRRVHISVAAPPAPPPGEGKMPPLVKFDKEGGLEGLCNAWYGLLEAYRTHFDGWLEAGPERAAEGMKTVLAQAMKIHKMVGELAGDVAEKSRAEKEAEVNNGKYAVEELRRRVDLAGAAFLRKMDGVKVNQEWTDRGVGYTGRG